MGRAPSGIGNWRIVLSVAGGAAVLGLGGLYATGLAAGDDIAEGTRVRGVDIGGMSRAEAQRVLDQKLGPAFAAPVALKIGDRIEKADPGALGLSLDAAASADRAASAGSDPVTVIGRLFASDGRDVEPVIRMDELKSRAEIDRIGAAAKQQVRDGAISFEKGKAKAVAPVTGITVTTDQALDTIRDAYLRTPAAGPVVLPLKQTQPRIGPQETERAMREFARPAMSGPVTLTLAEKRISIGPSALGSHLTMKPDAQKRLVPALDSKGLLADSAVSRPVREAAQSPRDAVFRLDGNDRVVVAQEARVGRPVTEKALGEAVVPLLTRSGAARTGEIATTEVQPQLTSASAQRLGILEKVSSFTVNFPAAPYRSTNIGRAVELINGSVVLPGQEWSFNRTVGKRTKENGFVDGLMINNGQYEKSPGGGVSAVATTMFNAMFFAGVKPVEHGAHSFYIERYPEGREATVAWGTLDLRWTNDSGHALYIQAESTSTSVTITFLGTKKYDEIRATKGPRTNIKQPGTRTGSGPKCEVQTPLEGFDISVGRDFVQDGRNVKHEAFKTHYTPRDKVTCTPEEPAPTAAADRPDAPRATATPDSAPLG
ncbi:VanW family protein [Streptomyces lunaelactis]|uniref:VanW family protein n=1 Tax=Streptomyces lunaelactis TaxID=1535768 RepID=UPI001584F115|nr:VanW family protein [Streptomyces lunaelactis]NUK54456.1 VanW family protein [Streptomyces lunaelactis]NUK64917.1 VanW family protein [Streptomyces lunaelactis]NUK72894.1 VanW family protein [Streptomyces lunaelactis]NUK81414.1 VanW family protein [Streptomyces lunaelactis]